MEEFIFDLIETKKNRYKK